MSFLGGTAGDKCEADTLHVYCGRPNRTDFIYFLIFSTAQTRAHHVIFVISAESCTIGRQSAKLR